MKIKLPEANCLEKNPDNDTQCISKSKTSCNILPAKYPAKVVHLLTKFENLIDYNKLLLDLNVFLTKKKYKNRK